MENRDESCFKVPFFTLLKRWKNSHVDILFLSVSTIVVVWMAINSVLICRLSFGICMASLVECIRALLRCLTVRFIDIVLVVTDIVNIFAGNPTVSLDLISR